MDTTFMHLYYSTFYLLLIFDLILLFHTGRTLIAAIYFVDVYFMYFYKFVNNLYKYYLIIVIIIIQQS